MAIHESTTISGQVRTGRYVIVQINNGGDYLNLKEVKAFGEVQIDASSHSGVVLTEPLQVLSCFSLSQPPYHLSTRDFRQRSA